VSRIGVSTHVRTLELVVIADLDTLLIALYVEQRATDPGTASTGHLSAGRTTESADRDPGLARVTGTGETG
jgi:hypothetical protein